MSSRNAEGLSCTEIAYEVGCSESTVKRKLKDTKAKRDLRIIELKADGLSIRDIAAIVKCSKNTVARILSKQKTTTPKSNPKDAQHEKAPARKEIKKPNRSTSSTR